MSFAAIALCLGMSVILGGGAGQAHESSFEKPDAESSGDRGGDLLEGLTRRLLDHRLGAEERREIAAARREHLAELMQRDPAQVLARALPPGARAALDPDLRARVQEILDVELADDELAWELQSDGTWTKVESRRGVNTHRRLEEYSLERAGVLPGPHA